MYLRAPCAAVADYVSQSIGMKKQQKLQTLRTACSKPCAPSTMRGSKITRTSSLLVFSAAGRQPDHSKLCYIAGLLFGDVKSGSHFNLPSLSSHMCRRPLRSIGAAEILAGGEAIDEGKGLAITLYSIYSTPIPLFLALDSRDSSRRSLHDIILLTNQSVAT